MLAISEVVVTCFMALHEKRDRSVAATNESDKVAGDWGSFHGNRRLWIYIIFQK